MTQNPDDFIVIRVEKIVAEKLSELKIHERQPYSEVIKILISEKFSEKENLKGGNK